MPESVKSEEHPLSPSQQEVRSVEVSQAIEGTKRRKYSRFILAALGSIPWVGGFLAATSAADSESEQGEVNHLFQGWMEEHQLKIAELAKIISLIVTRLDELGEIVEERVQDESYLDIVRKGFRLWNEADSEDKRVMIRSLLTNAGSTKLCSDDLVRLFLDWLKHYHEIHFAVIRAIYRKPSTRFDIWNEIKGEPVRDDSAEADLFRRLIRDLSTGGIIRQEREINYAGQFLKKKRTRTRPGSQTRVSAFDTEEYYELTNLGKQFVHYVMNEPAPRLTR